MSCFHEKFAWLCDRSCKSMEFVFNCGLQSELGAASGSAQLAGSPKRRRHLAILLTPTTAHRHRGQEKGKEFPPEAVKKSAGISESDCFSTDNFVWFWKERFGALRIWWILHCEPFTKSGPINYLEAVKKSWHFKNWVLLFDWCQCFYLKQTRWVVEDFANVVHGLKFPNLTTIYHFNLDTRRISDVCKPHNFAEPQHGRLRAPVRHPRCEPGE